ncbi:MAG: hypothetical protein KKD39_04580 [Candidatus Altiarchaeota archaeon]|nr:hypothetical protein [Candidatus Altiarchaeota archaeon]
MDERSKTGVPGLDELLNGGLPRGGTYSILGYAGSGKTILSLAFIYNGAVKYDEPGIYILVEEDKERLLSNMKDFGWDLEGLEKEKKITILPYIRCLMGDVEASFETELMSADPSRVERLREFLTVDTLYKQIKEAVEELDAKRVVIDSMTMITLLTDNQVSGRLQVMWLIEKLRKLDVTTVVTLEEGISCWKDIPFLCDGMIYMMLKEREGIFERGLVIEKMRGTSHDTGMRPIKIRTPEGIVVYPDELIFKRGSSKD